MHINRLFPAQFGPKKDCQKSLSSAPVLTMCYNLMCFVGQLPDHFVLIPDKPITVLRGGTAQIICEAEGISATEVQWKKVLPSSLEQSVPDSMVTNAVDYANNLVRATLRITNAQPQDTGDYKCTLTAYGKAAHKLTSVRVDGKFVSTHHN